MEKQIDKYAKLFEEALIAKEYLHVDERVNIYKNRLREMYTSSNFTKYNQYPTMDVYMIFAIIAMCLELRKCALFDHKIIDFVNFVFTKRRESFAFLYKIINALPFSYKIAEKWNISDHDKRVKDGSLTYDYFNVSEDKIEYRITKCKYIEIFEDYGIRKLCKIFCLTDISAYSQIPKHVSFTRYSDLTCGDCCHDIICKRK